MRCESCGSITDSMSWAFWPCGCMFRSCCMQKYLRATQELKCPSCYEPRSVTTYFVKKCSSLYG